MVLTEIENLTIFAKHFTWTEDVFDWFDKQFSPTFIRNISVEICKTDPPTIYSSMLSISDIFIVIIWLWLLTKNLIFSITLSLWQFFLQIFMSDWPTKTTKNRIDKFNIKSIKFSAFDDSSSNYQYIFRFFFHFNLKAYLKLNVWLILYESMKVNRFFLFCYHWR